MRGFGRVALVALAVFASSGCGGGDKPLAVAGAGGEGTQRTAAEGEGGSSSGKSRGAAGEEARSGSADAGRRGSDGTAIGTSGAGSTCEKGTLECACYGNDTCNEGLRCVAGRCRQCEDGDKGCSCFANDTCNDELTCKSGSCVADPGTGQGGAPSGPGGSTPGETGRTSPRGTAGSSAEATGGSSQDATGGSSPEGIGGQAPGTGGASTIGCSDPNIIDDFEDGDLFACPRSGWTSDWWTDCDDYGETTPSRANVEQLAAALDPARGTSRGALHLQGSGFEDWGAIIGFTFNNPNQDVAEAVDLSKYMGIEFWALGTGEVRLQVPTVDTMPEDAGGTCPGDYGECGSYFESDLLALASTWTRYRINFSSLVDYEQPGGMSDTDKQGVLHVFFSLTDDFDLWLDDVAFY